jgi:uncharacterized membrane protein YgdD (TMEM256/DUF423 family)
VRSRAGALGAWACAAGVLAGAFDAHALRATLDEHHLQLWETAARYAVIGGFGLLACGLAGTRPLLRPAAWSLGLGALVFCGTVGALALGGPVLLGAVTPLGGVGMIVGFVLLGVALARGQRDA